MVCSFFRKRGIDYVDHMSNSRSEGQTWPAVSILENHESLDLDTFTQTWKFVLGGNKSSLILLDYWMIGM